MSILTQVSCHLDDCCFLPIISSKIGKSESSSFILPFQAGFGYSGSLENFRSSLSISTEKSAGILIRIALDWFGEQYHLSILTLPIHGRKMSFHLFNSTLSSLNNVLSFQSITFVLLLFIFSG